MLGNAPNKGRNTLPITKKRSTSKELEHLPLIQTENSLAEFPLQKGLGFWERS